MDIRAGNALVRAIKPIARKTNRPGVIGSVGGFGGLFDLNSAGFKDPILIAATDGVGTKLKIAHETGIHKTIGIDLVAMCVNDLVTQGGEPLFFLDYLATGKLDTKTATDIINSIAEGCLSSGAALIGGETAEMPGLYGNGEYDLAGFSVGAVERNDLLPRKDIVVNDIILGLASNGLHSNGFSLVREIVKRNGLKFDKPAPFNTKRLLGDVLLEPTRIYVKSCLKAIKTGGVKALAHITGGGLTENVPRVLPEGLGVDLYARAWDLPVVFSWLAKSGKIAPSEMLRTFNCGIGMIIIASPNQAPGLQKLLHQQGETIIPIGKVVSRSQGETVIIHDMDQIWEVQ